MSNVPFPGAASFRSPWTWSWSSLVVALGMVGVRAAEPARFYGVGDLPGGIVFSQIRDATRVDGRILAVGGGTAVEGSTGLDTPILWSSANGLIAIPNAVTNLTAATPVFASAITRDGRYIAGRTRTVPSGGMRKAARVSTDTLLTTVLAEPAGFQGASAANTISDDGLVLYGFGDGLARAARYTADGAPATPIPPLDVDDAVNIPAGRGASADGSVMVGTSGPANQSTGAGNRAFRYQHGAGVSVIPLLTGGTWNTALAVTPDGNLTLVVGDMLAATQDVAYVHNATNGNLTLLGNPIGHNGVGNFGGLTADGRAAVVAFGNLAFLRNASGWRPMETVLRQAGLNLTDWSEFGALGVSPDGRLIFGSAVHLGNREGYVAEFPAGFLADFGLPFTDQLDARLAVTEPFPNRISGLTGSVSGDNVYATAEAGEPAHAGYPAGASVWLTWTPDVDGIARLNTVGSDFDSVLAVYRAPAAAAPTMANLVLLAANDDASAGSASALSFNVRKGETYHVAVAGAAALGRGGRGRIVFNWQTEETPFRQPRILATPRSATAAVGDMLGFSLELEPEPGVEPKITWFKLQNGQPAELAVATGPTLTFDSVNEAGVGIYFAEVVYDYGDGNVRTARSGLFGVQLYQRSNASDRTVLAEDKFVRSQLSAPVPGAAGAQRAGRGGIKPLGLARGVSGTQVFTTAGSTADIGEPVHCGVPGGASKWYALLAENDGIISVSTAGSDFDTVLAIYYDTGTGEGLFDGLVPMECSNDLSAADKSSAVTFCAQAGNVYYAVVDGVGGATGLARLNYQMAAGAPGAACPAPSFACVTNVPLRVVLPGAALTLSVPLAGNSQPVDYEWRRDGVPLAGATAASLLIPAAATNTGLYSLRLRSNFGESTAVVARVKVGTDMSPMLGYEQPCDGVLKIQFAAVPGRAVVLESATGQGAWTPVVTNLLPTGVGEYVPPASSGEDAVIYRLREQ